MEYIFEELTQYITSEEKNNLKCFNNDNENNDDFDNNGNNDNNKFLIIIFENKNIFSITYFNNYKNT